MQQCERSANYKKVTYPSSQIDIHFSYHSITRPRDKSISASHHHRLQPVAPSRLLHPDLLSSSKRRLSKLTIYYIVASSPVQHLSFARRLSAHSARSHNCLTSREPFNPQSFTAYRPPCLTRRLEPHHRGHCRFVRLSGTILTGRRPLAAL